MSRTCSKNRLFTSVFAKHIKMYIAMKKKLGLKFSSQIHVLRNIDEFAIKTSQKGPGITKEFSELWKNKSPHEHIKTTKLRVSILISFSSFLADLGVESYIPSPIKISNSEFMPYIFTHKQIYELFAVSDTLSIKRPNQTATLISYPLFIRFLYATGVRLGEAKALKDEDINLKENYVIIKDSKNSKQRMIPISDTLIENINRYNYYKKYIVNIDSREKYFFVNGAGEKCGSISHYYKRCLRELEIKCINNNKTPRIHDLRHTFAVHSLVAMVKSGLDIYCALPILSTYLGHIKIRSTENYIRLTKSMFPDIIKDTDLAQINIFPKPII